MIAAPKELSKAQIIKSLPKKERQKFFDSLTPQQEKDLQYDWSFWGRPKQQLPPLDGTWDTAMWLAGRGFGKSRTGSEIAKELMMYHGYKHITFIARTLDDCRYTMIEGESGLLSVLPPSVEYDYQPGNKRVIFPQFGAVIRWFSADKPDSLRGPQHEAIICDELAAWRYPQDAWDNAQFGLRLGKNPIAIVLTTPRPTKLVRELVGDARTNENPYGRVIMRTGTTYENKNLSPKVRRKFVEKYAGTRIGRQELLAEVLTDTPGALWTTTLIEQTRASKQPNKFVRIIVGVDPNAKSSGAECGIIVAGLGDDNLGYLIDDRTISGTPAKWGRAAYEAWLEHEADLIVAEVNNGGDMVEHTIVSTVAEHEQKPTIKQIRASRNKQTRAEPIATLYERKRIKHLGVFAECEDQMCTWVPGEESPDRMDAAVWAFTELMLEDGKHTPPATRKVKVQLGTRRGSRWQGSLRKRRVA